MRNTTYKTTVAQKSADFAKSCVAECKKLLARIEAAKASILREFSDVMNGHEQVLRLAVNEAEAIAWETEFPYLVFPTLAQEKAQAVAHWADHQRYVRNGRTLAA
jgi:hypothetical protein